MPCVGSRCKAVCINPCLDPTLDLQLGSNFRCKLSLLKTPSALELEIFVMGKFFGHFDIYIYVCVYMYRYNEVYIYNIIIYYIIYIIYRVIWWGICRNRKGESFLEKHSGKLAHLPPQQKDPENPPQQMSRKESNPAPPGETLHSNPNKTCVCLRNPHIWTSRLEITRKANVLFGARGILVPSFFGPTPLLTTLSVAHHQTNKRADPRLSLVRRGHHQFQHGASMGRVETWISRAFHSQE
jgi:hypothetical protein